MVVDSKGHNVKLSKRVKDDLELSKAFLNKAKQGISTNLLTFRSPNIVYICDALEYGLGGFVSHGRASTYQIPVELRNIAHINIVEYLTQTISILIDILEHNVDEEVCILSI